MTCAEMGLRFTEEVYTFSSETIATTYWGEGNGVRVSRTEAIVQNDCHNHQNSTLPTAPFLKESNFHRCIPKTYILIQ